MKHYTKIIPYKTVKSWQTIEPCGIINTMIGVAKCYETSPIQNKAVV